MLKSLISVIIPTYNRSRILSRAIKSVLNQTYDAFEVIVVDDFSSDNTENVVRNFDDKRIKYYKNPKNLGGAISRNRGASLSSGEYIAFLDSDDEWRSDKLSEQINLFNRLDNSFGVVYCGHSILLRNGHLKEIVRPKIRGGVTKEALIENFVGSFSVVVIKREIFEKVGGLDERFLSVQDKELYVRLSKVCNFDYVNKTLVNYYMTNDIGRISNNRNAVISGRLLFFEKYKNEFTALEGIDRARAHMIVAKQFIELGAIKEGLMQNALALKAGKAQIIFQLTLKIIRGFIVYLKRSIICHFRNKKK